MSIPVMIARRLSKKQADDGNQKMETLSSREKGDMGVVTGLSEYKQGARKPGYGGSLFPFNSQKIRDKKHGDTIKISIPKALAILNRIAGSYTMVELQTILA